MALPPDEAPRRPAPRTLKEIFKDILTLRNKEGDGFQTIFTSALQDLESDVTRETLKSEYGVDGEPNVFAETVRQYEAFLKGLTPDTVESLSDADKNTLCQGIEECVLPLLRVARHTQNAMQLQPKRKKTGDPQSDREALADSIKNFVSGEPSEVVQWQEQYVAFVAHFATLMAELCERLGKPVKTDVSNEISGSSPETAI